MIVLIFTASGRFPRGVRQASTEARLLRCLGCHASPAGVAALRSKQRDLQKSTLNDNTANKLRSSITNFLKKMFPNGGSTGLEKDWLHPYKKRTKSLNNYQMIDKALLMIKNVLF